MSESSRPPSSSVRRRRVDRREVAAIFAGAAVGTLLRVALGRWMAADPAAWPWDTFAVNVVAAFTLGYVITRPPARRPPGYRLPFLGTGFCGGLSTFSTMQVEVLHMFDAGAYGLAAGYTAASVAAGYGAVHFAIAAARGARTAR